MSSKWELQPADIGKFGGVDLSDNRPRNQRTRDVERANTISVVKLLDEEFGVYVPPELGGKSWKIDCPFAWEHVDAGLDKNCRCYPASNHVYCFATMEHGRLTPVKLWAVKNGWQQGKAARDLLAKYGLSKPRDYRERFAELIQAREQQGGVGASSYAVEALQQAMGSVRGYDRRQYDPDVVGALEEQLEALDSLVERSAGRSEMREWYRNARDELSRVVEG